MNRPILSLKSLEQCLIQLRKQIKRKIDIFFTGGEPLLYPDKIIDYLDLINCYYEIGKVTICTNGFSCEKISIFDKKIYIKSLVYIVTIDVWGNSKTRITNDGKKINGETILNDFVNRKNQSELRVSNPVTNFSCWSDINRIINFCRSNGISVLDINLLKDYCYSDFNKTQSLLIRIYKVKNLYDNRLKICGNWIDYVETGEKVCKRRVFENSLVVNPNGQLVICELELFERVSKVSGDTCPYYSKALNQIDCELFKLNA